MGMEDVNSICPANQQEWRQWLEANHVCEDAIWLIIHKKASATPTISWSEAVDQALCFGWIDGKKQAIDNEKYRQYFCKRKADSTWSKINKDKVEKLIDEGLMSSAGYKTIEIAKENGSWILLDEVENLTIPEDLEKEFSNNPGSKAFFESLSKSLKKGLLQWIVLAKRSATRKKRIIEISESAANGLMPKQFR